MVGAGARQRGAVRDAGARGHPPHGRDARLERHDRREAEAGAVAVVVGREPVQADAGAHHREGGLVAADRGGGAREVHAGAARARRRAGGAPRPRSGPRLPRPPRPRCWRDARRGRGRGCAPPARAPPRGGRPRSHSSGARPLRLSPVSTFSCTAAPGAVAAIRSSCPAVETPRSTSAAADGAEVGRHVEQPGEHGRRRPRPGAARGPRRGRRRPARWRRPRARRGPR